MSKSQFSCSIYMLFYMKKKQLTVNQLINWKKHKQHHVLVR